MARRKAVRQRVGAHVAEAQRSRLSDQNAQYAVAPRQIPDFSASALINALAHEALELSPVVVQHSDGCVARSRQLPSDVQQPIEDAVELELRAQRRADLDQAA